MTTLEQINVGTSANDNTGDPIRTGGQKINNNTTKIGNLLNKIDIGLIQVFKYPGNSNVTVNVQQKDIVTGIIESAGVKYFIKAQYNTGLDTDFGTVGGFFNDGSYNTISFDELL